MLVPRAHMYMTAQECRHQRMQKNYCPLRHTSPSTPLVGLLGPVVPPPDHRLELPLELYLQLLVRVGEVATMELEVAWALGEGAEVCDH